MSLRGYPEGAVYQVISARDGAVRDSARLVAHHGSGWEPAAFLMTFARPPFPVVNLASALLAGPWSKASLVARGTKACAGDVQWIRATVRRLLQIHEAPPTFDALLEFLGHDPRQSLLKLARALRAGPWNVAELMQRGAEVWPHDAAWLARTVQRLVQRFGPEKPPSLELLQLLLESRAPRWCRPAHLQVGRCFFVPGTMAPRGQTAASWHVPALTSAGELAAWLDVTPAQLYWLADVRGWTVRQPNAKLRHYVYQWRPRRRGRFRLIESPKATLKRMQRRILHDLLDRVPPHEAAHGFRQGRSIASYAAAHVGRRIVLRFDLRDFFPSIRAARVHALFRTIGYPDEVARLLTGLCTSLVPADVWDSRPEPRAGDVALGDCLRSRHLPQGAPTSPALANLCARRLDARLDGLAQTVGAVYTRYADDLAFSGDEALERACRRFQVAVAVIAAEEGFEVHFQKSRFMRQGVCQQLAGVVVNVRLNVRRRVYDELKAVLTNCIRHGPHTQNRTGHADFRGHLLGRIAHVSMLHPGRGAKLAEMFGRIAWQ